MLHFAIEYRPALDKITAKRENNLRSFELSGEEWKIASSCRHPPKVRRGLHDVLEVSATNACLHDTIFKRFKHQVFKDATMFFSRSTPNLATVIPAIDHIDEILTSHRSNISLNPAVQSALALGKKTLDRYYSLTDSSDVYRIAMGRHHPS
jgi:hypothetical protein